MKTHLPLLLSLLLTSLLPAQQPTTAPAPQPKLLFTTTSNTIYHSYAYPPASDGEDLFVAYRNDVSTHLLALSDSGKQLEVYFPTLTSNPMIVSRGTLFVTNPSDIWAISCDSKKVLWKAPCQNTPSAPAANAETVVFAEHGLLRALARTTGDESWHTPNPKGAIGAPALFENTIFLADDNSNLASFNLPDGKELARTKTAPFTTGPAIDPQSKTLYLGTTTGVLAADFNLKTLWHTKLVSEKEEEARSHNFSFRAFGTTGGPNVKPPEGYVHQGMNPPLLHSGTLYFTFHDRLVALDAATGKTKWTYTPAPAKPNPDEKDPKESTHNFSFFIKGDTPNSGTTVSFPRTPTQPLLAAGTLYLGTPAGLAALDAATGNPLWLYPTPAPIAYTPALAQRTLAATLTTGETLALQLPPPLTPDLP